MSLENKFQQLWMSLSEEEHKALFAFLDLDDQGSIRSWFNSMLAAMSVPEGVLAGLVAKNILDMGEEKGDNTVYRIADAAFYRWAVEQFTQE